MKLIIAGSRDFHDYAVLQWESDQIIKGLPHSDITILCGEAKGADLLGRVYATQKGLKIESHPAKWNEFGRGAGFIRNAEMVKSGTHLIAFWDGKSKGTEHMIKTAEHAGLIVKIIKYEA